MIYDYAFVGAGNMAEAMVRGLLAGGQEADRVLMTDNRADRLETLKSELDVAVTLQNERSIQARMVVLAVKPQVLPKAMAGLKGKFSSENLVVSIAAGVTLERLRKGLGDGPRLVRAMPNTPALVGQAASAYTSGVGTHEGDSEAVEKLLQSFGCVVEVEEDKMDVVTALSGSGPAYVFLFMEALVEAAESAGLDENSAFKLACQTLVGGSAMIAKGHEGPAALRKKVTSPGGTTEAALKAFEKGDLRGLVKKAVEAARNRSRELGSH